MNIHKNFVCVQLLLKKDKSKVKYYIFEMIEVPFYTEKLIFQFHDIVQSDLALLARVSKKRLRIKWRRER
jgi:hypothetical protein